MKDFATNFPALYSLSNIAYILFFFVIIWIFGRMGDNINKIRKMLEEEISKKNNQS